MGVPPQGGPVQNQGESVKLGAPSVSDLGYWERGRRWNCAKPEGHYVSSGMCKSKKRAKGKGRAKTER